MTVCVRMACKDRITHPKTNAKWCPLCGCGPYHPECFEEHLKYCRWVGKDARTRALVYD
jgi:hypothetical protein